MRKSNHHRLSNLHKLFSLAVFIASSFGVSTLCAGESGTPSRQLSLLGGGWSWHLSDDFEPNSGYEEFHEAIGLHFETGGDEWVYGLLAVRFLDSFWGNSFLTGATFKYRKTFENKMFIYGGLAIGYVDTTYYHGPAAAPITGFGYGRMSFNLSYLPATEVSDELFLGLVSIRIFEW